MALEPTRGVLQVLSRPAGSRPGPKTLVARPIVQLGATLPRYLTAEPAGYRYDDTAPRGSYVDILV